MATVKEGSQEFQPYARLMNIIGDQLITDKKVAVIEIIKNCYDADAENVYVRFKNLENYGRKNLPVHEQASIEIEDNGDGMTLDIIQRVWLRPATPNKLDKKARKLSFTNKGRIIQGEKGVGRFAIHKLGEKIEVYTKAIHNDEINITLDFEDFNPEKEEVEQDYKLLKDVQNHWTVESPPLQITKSSGTLIIISKLRENWSERDIRDLVKNIFKLIPPKDPLGVEKLSIELKNDFNVELTVDGKVQHGENLIKFEDVLQDAPFKLSGSISPNGLLNFEYFSTLTNRNIKNTISLFDTKLKDAYNYDLYSVKYWFSTREKRSLAGFIRFSLYSYNLASSDGTQLTKDLKDFVKDNFVYVYRDGVRVYPYGEKEIDWLDLDKLRAQYQAGAFLSYNDLLGFVYITQEGNPKLKDSTNRQGIVNTENAYDDFRYSVLAAAEILTAERKIDIQSRKIEKERSYNQSTAIYRISYEGLKKSLSKVGNVEVLEKANKFLDDVDKHTSLMKDRMSTVEDLAGLGMAVERASHDSIMLLSKMRINLKKFIQDVKLNKYDKQELTEFLNQIDENLAFVYDEMQIIQPLFKIQRKAVVEVSLAQSIDKVVKYFKRDLEDKVDVKLNIKDFIVKTNTGLILQVLINLLDNAIYWVNKGDSQHKKIEFKVDELNKTMIIADNGPGIRSDIVPMVFTEFFSLKSDGRGLGLYIVHEILLRINATIAVVQEENKKLLPGANFIINFNTQE